MENASKVFAGAMRAGGPLEYEMQRPEDWRHTRAAYLSLLLLGMPRVNLLLIGVDSMVWNVLGTLLLDLREPITTWSPGEPLALPPGSRAGTMILHDLGAMAHDDQLRLLEWLERSTGRTQVVSTTSAPLLPRVKAGAFLERLFYRLNTICVDLAA